RFSSLIVLVSFRQVLFRDSGEVVAVAAVQATVDALAVHRRPQRRRQLVYRGLLGRVPESALGECYGGGPVIAAMVSLAPGSGAQVVGGHDVSKSSGLGMSPSVSHSRASIADAAMCDAWATVPHAPDEPKPTSVKSSSPGRRRVMLNSTRYSGRSSVVTGRPPLGTGWGYRRPSSRCRSCRPGSAPIRPCGPRPTPWLPLPGR